jgi:hypothetical protein
MESIKPVQTENRVCSICNERKTISPHSPFCGRCMAARSREMKKAKAGDSDRPKASRPAPSASPALPVEGTTELSVMTDVEKCRELFKAFAAALGDGQRALNVQIAIVMR